MDSWFRRYKIEEVSSNHNIIARENLGIQDEILVGSDHASSSTPSTAPSGSPISINWIKCHGTVRPVSSISNGDPVGEAIGTTRNKDDCPSCTSFIR